MVSAISRLHTIRSLSFLATYRQHNAGPPDIASQRKSAAALDALYADEGFTPSFIKTPSIMSWPELVIIGLYDCWLVGADIRSADF